MTDESGAPLSPRKNAVRTRGALVGLNVRYVLAVGLAGVIIAFLLIALYFGGLPF